LITGASRGIGRAIANAYAAEGANLLLAATHAGKLEETRALVAEHGIEAACHLADLSDPGAVEGLFAAALRWREDLDIVVNNAGIYIGKPFTDYDLAEFDRVMKVNVSAVFQLMQLTLRYMRGRGAGKIVNIASTAGRWESPNQAAYNTGKRAVVGMTRCAALENAALGINVNAISVPRAKENAYTPGSIPSVNREACRCKRSFCRTICWASLSRPLSQESSWRRTLTAFSLGSAMR